MAETHDLPVPEVTEGEPQANARPLRVKLRGSVLVLIRLPNRREMRASLHLLSVTGGLINLDQPLDEKLEVELIFHVAEDTVRSTAQMLFPMWATQGWLQPFRFVDLTEAGRNSLAANLRTYLGESARGAAAGG